MKAAANGSWPVSLRWAARTQRSYLPPTPTLTQLSKAPCGSCFANRGQVCLGNRKGGEAVERPIFDKARGGHEGRCRNSRSACPKTPAINMGPLVSKEHQNKVLVLHAHRRRRGATVVTGGGILTCRSIQGRLLGPAHHLTGLPKQPASSRRRFGPCCHIAPSTLRKRYWPRRMTTSMARHRHLTSNVSMRQPRRPTDGSGHRLGE